jgi:multiple sugar transport system substrate-binding protein
LVFAVSGCGNAASNDVGVNTQTQTKHDPVTVTIGIKSSGYLTEEEFNRYITEPVKQKYPWITAERVVYTNNNLPDFVTRGDTPDLIITNNINGMPQLDELGLLEPMDALIKKYNIDVAKIEDGAVEAVKSATGRPELVALPYTRNFSALYYSKDIFDKFATPYPKDGMTWEQAAELAKRVTRTDAGVQYRGLEPNVPERLGAQLSLGLVDPKTNRALINSDAWKKVISQMAAIYQIPGNGSITTKGKGQELFTKSRTLAMHADVNILFSAHLDEISDFNWDMVSMPVWPQAPKAGMSPDEHLFVLSKTSKHKDDAMNVIATVLSDEVQLDMSKNGRTSIMKDPKIRNAFAESLSFMKGKNIQAIFKTELAKPYDSTLYDTLAMAQLGTALKNIVTKGNDVNTALREAEETVNKQIDEKLAQ